MKDPQNALYFLFIIISLVVFTFLALFTCLGENIPDPSVMIFISLSRLLWYRLQVNLHAGELHSDSLRPVRSRCWSSHLPPHSVWGGGCGSRRQLRPLLEHWNLRPVTERPDLSFLELAPANIPVLRDRRLRRLERR